MRLSQPRNERWNIQPVDQYRVVVGESGIVFDGDSRSEAMGQFDQFVVRSIRPFIAQILQERLHRADESSRMRRAVPAVGRKEKKRKEKSQKPTRPGGSALYFFGFAEKCRCDCLRFGTLRSLEQLHGNLSEVFIGGFQHQIACISQFFEIFEPKLSP